MNQKNQRVYDDFSNKSLRDHTRKGIFGSNGFNNWNESEEGTFLNMQKLWRALYLINK